MADRRAEVALMQRARVPHAAARTAERGPDARDARPGALRGWAPIITAVAALVVLGAGWLAVRAPAPATAGRHAAAIGSRREAAAAIDVLSDPDHAHVHRDGKLVGTTPTTLTLGAGERAELLLSKPGYLPGHVVAIGGVAPGIVRAALPPVASFDGIWQLPSGELRQLERRKDDVMIYQLDSIDGPRRADHRYEFESADGERVQFAAVEDTVDERAPGDPTCHLALRIAYTYEPSGDVLTVQREHAELVRTGGHCEVERRSLADPVVLRRRAARSPAEPLSQDASGGLQRPARPMPAGPRS